MKIANIDREILRIFWTTWRISMKFMILKVTKNQGFTVSLEDIFFRKLHRGRVNLTPPSSLVALGLMVDDSEHKKAKGTKSV